MVLLYVGLLNMLNMLVFYIKMFNLHRNLDH